MKSSSKISRTGSNIIRDGAGSGVEECSGDENMENWKQFQGTELGSLLGSIYGKKTSINYPKPKAGNKPLSHGTFISGGSVDAADPRKSTRKKVEVEAPTFSKKSGPATIAHPVDYIPHRRQETVIRAELDDIKMRQTHYRPAHTHAISSETEKQRFSEICTYKGGKGLPIVLPVAEAPFEIAERERIARLNEEHRFKRTGIPAPSKPRQSNISADEQLAMQITSEIDERRAFIEESRSRGALTTQEENKLKGEIASRLRELQRLDV